MYFVTILVYIQFHCKRLKVYTASVHLIILVYKDEFNRLVNHPVPVLLLEYYCNLANECKINEIMQCNCMRKRKRVQMSASSS